MRRKMIKIQLQTKLKSTINNIKNKNTPYDIKEFSRNPEKCKGYIGSLIKTVK